MQAQKDPPKYLSYTDNLILTRIYYKSIVEDNEENVLLKDFVSRIYSQGIYKKCHNQAVTEENWV